MDEKSLSIDASIQAKRDYFDLMYKNRERGLLDKGTLRDLKKLGIDFEYEQEQYDIENTSTAKFIEKESDGTTMTINNMLVDKQHKMGEIADNEWRPLSIIDHTQDFVEWINSMTFGIFPEKKRYDKFEKYKAQAQYWTEIYQNPYDTESQEERRDIILNEYNRIDRNTLYFSMQYNWIAEGSVREGRIRYVPKEQNAVIFYMLDCGYLFVLGKPRQIFATTTIGIFVNKKLITQENFFMVLITEDETTAKGILNDKIKAPFRYYYEYLKPEVDRDYIKGFKLGKSKKKGDGGVPNSRVEVLAPSKTAINSGAPQIVLIDEAASTPDLIPMILEQRPTLYMDLNQDGKLQIKRQIVIWSTGTTNTKGKMQYHSLFSNIINLWNEHKFEAALFVPLFFSWHSRCTKEVYENARLSYYSGDVQDLQGYSQEERKQIFHMHYPTTWMDMFALVTNKLVPTEIIAKHQTRIRELPMSSKPKYGRFVPIYDFQSPLDEKVFGITHKIIGSRFIPYDDNDNDPSRITAQLLYAPEEWNDRYFQGTDPVETDVGQSLFASVIWDKHYNTIPCLINYRPNYDQKDAFLQSILMSIFFDHRAVKIGVPELIENNIGTLYKTYKELIGYDKNIIFNSELPPELQGGGSNWGINTRQKRKEVIVGETKDIAISHGDNINHEIFFRQLDTYIPVAKQGGYNYEPADRRLYKDDVLDAAAMAKICSKTIDKMPSAINQGEEQKKRLITRPGRTKNGTYILEQVYI